MEAKKLRPSHRRGRSRSDGRQRYIYRAIFSRVWLRLCHNRTGGSSRHATLCGARCHTIAAGLNSSLTPADCILQHRSTSSPAVRKTGSKPPTAESASLRNAILHPGRCSASTSVSITWIGPPGESAAQSETVLSPGGRIFGPPAPAHAEEGPEEP